MSGLGEEPSSVLGNDFADLLCLTDYEKQLATAFESPDVTLVFSDNRGNEEKLYVKKEHLSKVSPVFSVMFSSDFKEASAEEIPLKGKKLSTFIHFLRLALPGHVDELKVDIAHAVLPYVEEYQTEELKIKIDKFLAEETTKSGDNIYNDDLVQNIIEAEKYALNDHLQACINVGTRRKSKCLVSELLYDKISKETQLQIAHQRLKSLENLYEDTIQIKPPSYNRGYNRGYRTSTKPDIVDWKHHYLNTDPTDSTPSARCKELLKGIMERFSDFMTK